MNKPLTGSNGMRFSARLLRSTTVTVAGVALSFAFWAATTSTTMAQGNSPAQSLQQGLPQGKTVDNASKADLLAAVLSAVKKNSKNAPVVVRIAAKARPEWSRDILRTAFLGVGLDNCDLLVRIYRELIAIDPEHANELTELAIDLAPGCAGGFGGGGAGGGDQGNYGQSAGNQNPAPGSVSGGGGGQGNVVAICHNGKTIFVSPQGAQNHLAAHSGDSLGPCVVTPASNQ